MAASDRERWDTRHAAVSVGEPMPPGALLGREDLLPGPGRALDVACGRGAVAVWLALRGFAVDAVDVSAAGLDGGAELAGQHGVGDRIRWVRADLDDGLPDAGPGYDVVVCQRFRERSLYPTLAAVLRPGGLLVVTVLSEVGDEGGRFRARPGELLASFGDLHVIEHTERDGEASLLARRPS